MPRYRVEKRHLRIYGDVYDADNEDDAVEMAIADALEDVKADLCDTTDWSATLIADDTDA
jgi:hypothetical protein